MQFSMQIKHFFCIYPCILVVFFIVRPLPEYPAFPAISDKSTTFHRHLHSSLFLHSTV